ncbi:MAG: cytochrome b [Magnetovibrio sp.]|nr:cytochrome b [Magnetovibrio sp.]
MALKNSQNHFGVIAKFLHWLIALLMIALIGLGAYMVTLDYYDDEWYDGSLLLHKALGMVGLAVVGLKFIWMLKNPKPDDLPTLKSWEKHASVLAHITLLAVMFLMPVTGYVVSTSEGAGIAMFGLFEVPALFKISAAVRDMAIAIHFYLAYGGMALVLVHASAALKHHFINKDKTLRRIL